MKSSLTILAAATLLTIAVQAYAASPTGNGDALGASPSVGSVTSPSVGSVAPLTPQLNPGALGAPTEFGTPPVNTGAIGSINQQGIGTQSNFGALPGSPGSATYDPNAALPSLGNAGSALAPNPTTSGAGFGSPNTNSGTTPSLNGG